MVQLPSDADPKGRVDFSFEDSLSYDDEEFWHDAPPRKPDEEHQALQQRVLRSDVLIRQLKHIVRAQHNKIEDLRERLDWAESNVRNVMAMQDQSEAALLKDDNEELRRTVSRLRAEQAGLKKDNETLRKANRRMKAMLVQEQGDGPLGGERWTSVCATGCADNLPTETGCKGPRLTAPPLLSPSTCTAASSPPSTARSVGRPCGSRRSQEAGALPQFPKISKLISALPLFWQDMESPAAILQALVELSTRLLSDRPSAVVTLYAVDPFVRSDAPSGEQKGSGAPKVFYLGNGRTEVQVFPVKRCSARPEPPRFAELEALPYRTHSTVAIPLQMPNSHRTLAVLQVACFAEEPSGPGGAAAAKRASTPRVLRHSCNAAEAPELAGFTDSQLAHLQVVCNVAASSLYYIERLEQRAVLLERTRCCLEVAVTVNKARSLGDFEQRLKHLLGPFFNANIVRVLFFDPETKTLLLSCAQMRRKDYTSVSIDKGVVGLCAKKQAIISVSNISQHPNVDAMADGLQRTGRPVACNSAMLCGPLIVEQDDGSEESRLLGVVQLLERKKKAGIGAGTGDFTPEEQHLFQQLLQVFAHAGWRALKAQQLAAKMEGSPATLSRLLMG